MKKLFLMTFVALALQTQAQIAVLEHTYANAATWNIPQSLGSQLMLVNFEVSGYQYVHIDRVNRAIKIYSLSHVLVKTIPLSGLPLNPPYGQMGDFLYITEQLFNLDSKKEFMYVYQGTAPSGDAFFVTDIINEDGLILFSDTSVGLIRPNYEQQQFPIYNTPEGTKMILSNTFTGEAKVFALRGTLPCADPCMAGGGGGIGAINSPGNNGGMLSNPYPNPAGDNTVINYNLPDGVFRGEIIFYDPQGREVKRFSVDRTFNSLSVSTGELASGTYYYQMQTPNYLIGDRKMVVVK